MPTIEQHPTTESINTYSVYSTEKQRKQTPSEISTMYTTDLTPISTISQEARMNFETSEKTSHLTMQTLETKTKTDIIKQYSIKSTDTQRKRTT
ncbi:Hypothetical predicted protein [Mytilus galloprovincialis]|uniref:Uncharacterized protein n=1 Tax=Mytilus galloprovincialis TaxID=29158 RepID=A0A8B6GK95_MYTGA|nr:Hypothetical predicted protein [Mytilus galloprovincialis]